MVGGNYVIGAVIFLVLIAIQYVVINHGAVRISEVTARFTLDALPGKQMSIDCDLNAGLIDEVEAKRRRKALATEAEFYGAMDGASRFTQRDAVASILITAINIIAGFLIGVLQHGMDLRKAIETYTVLTIGDGLVTVIPALMISISGGLIVTRASSRSAAGRRVPQADSRQLAAPPAGGRSAGGAGRAARNAEAALPAAGWRRGRGGLEDAQEGSGAGRGARRGQPASRPPPRTTWNRSCASSRWPSKWGWGWSGWWKARRIRRCCAASPPSAGNWPATSAICCRRCA